MNLFRTVVIMSALLATGCMDTVQNVLQRRNAPRLELLEDDAIRIVLCGTNAPIPNPERAEACTAVFVGGEMLLFDAGDGAMRSILALRLPTASLSNIFLTHLHDDHMVGAGHVIHRSWIMGRENQVTLRGPVGTGLLVEAYELLYTLDRRYRVDHHGSQIMDPRFDRPIVHEIEADDPMTLVPVYRKGELVVSAFLVDHTPISPAFGYRVDYKGKSVVISGDTIATEGLEKHSTGADVLVSEVMNKDLLQRFSERLGSSGQARNAKILTDILNYHIGADELGALAERAGVKTLILTHLVPGMFNAKLINYFIFKRPVAAEFSGKVIVGRDGVEFEIPL
jgi:ribonuclease Z